MHRDAAMTPNESPSGNPFATRFVRPGAIPYLFPSGDSVERLIARLAECGWRGEIVGPHGSGKSTLLASLVEALERGGQNVVVYRLREGERRLPKTTCAVATLSRGALVVVDGYEQLPWWRRWALRRVCSRRGLGLLVTTHTPTGLPLLWQTSIDVLTVERVVAHLLVGDPTAAALISRDDVARAVARHPTDAREALFALYDVYERRRADGKT
jgi:hypothetical protein